MDIHRSSAVLYSSLLLIHLAAGFLGVRTIKPTSVAGDAATGTEAATRPNTLLDDADDLQRQLDNEARERFKQHPKTSWMLHLPGKSTQHYRAARASTVRVTKAKLSFTKGKFWNITKLTTTRPTTKSLPTTTCAPKWYYSNMSEWPKTYPACSGRAQSPVVVTGAVVRVRGARLLLFKHYDQLPTEMTLRNDGTKLVLSGRWAQGCRPSLWGGPAHSRRYLFHSAELHWPSEHRVGRQQFPLELQAVHVAAEYSDMHTAIHANDPEALLVVSYLYLYGNVTDPPGGVELLLSTAMAASKESFDYNQSPSNPESAYRNCIRESNNKNGTQLENSKGDKNTFDYLFEVLNGKYECDKVNVLPDLPKEEIKGCEDTLAPSAVPLKALFPVFTKDYATYAGSQTAPPCKEIVRWIIYSKPLSIHRDVAEAARSLRSAEGLMNANFRPPQPLNDRQIYYFY